MRAMSRMMLGAALCLALAMGCRTGPDEPAEEAALEALDAEAADPMDEDAAAPDAADGEDSAETDSGDGGSDPDGEDASDATSGEDDDEADAEAEAAPALPAAPRLGFESGSEGGIVSDRLAGGGQELRYRFAARAGQDVSLRLQGVSAGSIDLELHRSGGEMLATSADAEPAERNRLQTRLPASGDYDLLLRAVEGAPELDFELEVRITGQGEVGDDGAESDAPGDTDAAAPESIDRAEPDMQPLAVRFAPGADRAERRGQLELGDILTYRLSAAAGQELSLDVESSPEGAVDVMVFDAASRPMRAERRPEGSVFLLAQDADYLVTVSNPLTEAGAEYRITFDLGAGDAGGGSSDAGADASADEADADGETAAGAETQLFFSAGERQTTVQGSLAAGEETRYRLRAEGGQQLSLSLAADDPGAFQLYIEDQAGDVLGSGLEAEGLSVDLPSRQDYVIVLIARPGTPESLYSLTVSIE